MPRRATQRGQRRFEERDRLIRETARRLFVERGLHAFSMDDVAAAIDYSKGTVYQHYPSKEDALAASCADSCGELAAWFERAAAYPGRPRERMLAVAESYFLFVHEREVSFRSIPLIQSPAVVERVSPERLRAMEATRRRGIAAFQSVVHEAVSCGDLRLPRRSTVESVTFSLWALMFGAYLLAEMHRPQGILGIQDPEDTIREAWRACMDGLGWRPLSTARGQDTAARRAREYALEHVGGPRTAERERLAAAPHRRRARR